MNPFCSLARRGFLGLRHAASRARKAAASRPLLRRLLLRRAGPLLLSWRLHALSTNLSRDRRSAAGVHHRRDLKRRAFAAFERVALDFYFSS